MSLQLARVVLYSRSGEIRELEFRTGRLNILTGASKTGKSSLIDIVDYCTGRSECYVADGVIRKHVAWYGVLFAAGDGNVFVARRNPGLSEKTSPDVYIERGVALTTPPLSSLHKNTTVEALEKFLAATLGISENEHRPPVGQSRAPLEANFRHALIFAIQDQDDIDSKKILFHRQGDNWVAQAIKDTFPYFLGAIDEYRLLKQAELDAARRALRQLERQLREAESVETNRYPRANALHQEAKHVGLLDERAVATTHEAVLAALRQCTSDDYVRDDMIVGDGEEILTRLRTQRQGMRQELEAVKAELRATRLFESESTGYQREAHEQRARLSSIGLVKKYKNGDEHQCPLCETPLATPVPNVSAIEQSLRSVSDLLEGAEMENPRVQARMIRLRREEEALEQSLRENQRLINERLRENEILKVQQDNFVLQARVIGKITQYLETVSETQDGSNLRKAVDAARMRVEMLEQELDEENVQDRVEAYLNIIGRYMSDYSAHLDLEFRGSQLRLDMKHLTVVADTLDGPIPLYRMGSGENWVGYHVLAHLALHKWFRQKSRPVPAFLFLDQPSQAHYPPEEDVEGSIEGLRNEDQTAVRQLFTLILKVAEELAPALQIIVLDHADLKEEWFDSCVVERWRGGRKLVPLSWVGQD
ncbi:MAG: DUF3732 domain-containing protein [Polyangiaceae bacterium]